MKKIVLMLFAMAMALGASAESVSPERAMAAANAWVVRNGAFGAGQWATNVVTECDAANGNVVLWHQVSMAGGGMLVVAPVTEIEPVVMALDNDPGVLPEAHPLKGILRGDMRRRLKFLGLYPQGGVAVQTHSAAASTSSTDDDGTATAASVSASSTSDDGTDAASSASSTGDDVAKAWGKACAAKWARLTRPALYAGVGVEDVDVKVRVVKGFEKGGPLTHWDQGSYYRQYLYNYYTPNHAVCGCVATACAALAQFYGTKSAVKGYANPSCTYQDQAYRDVFGADAKTIGGDLDWSILPENWGGEAAASLTLTDEQRELIGRVAYDAGVGVGMMWERSDGSGSSAYMPNIVAALKDVFGFRNARCVRLSNTTKPSQSEMEKLIYNQCRAGVPVGMGIEGHAVVAVGYGLDAEGVERVRVFMGWAGSGDGWYALPKIDTTATVGGSSYLSETVDDIITMISYDDDDIVPVVGRVSVPGAQLEIAALERVVESDENGYFGTRVPANMGTCEVTCLGNTAQLDIGEAALEATEAAKLCADGVLPGAFEFVLLNCTTAYSLERAKLFALKEGKAILHVSGTAGAASTTAALNYIYELDEGNVNDFTNRFVFYQSKAGSAAGDGADLSYGVYLPSAVDPADRWQAKNGALAYGYSTSLTTLTNVTHDTSHEAETNGLDAVETTRVLTYTFAPIDGTPERTERDEGEVDAILADVTASLARVLDVGATRFAECTSGITVTIGATSKAAEAAIDAVADPAQACGVHANSYTNGPYTFTCDAVVTNEAAGVVLGCAGWSATNATTGAVLTGTGSTATLDLAANDAVSLTWDFSKTIAVYVKVVPQCQNGNGKAGPDTYDVTPGSGWYAWNEPVLFTATCDTGYAVNNSSWVLNRGTGVNLSAATFSLFVDEPGQLDVFFRKGGTMAEETVTNVQITATSWFINSSLSFEPAAAELAPTTTVQSATGALPLASGVAVEVPVVLDAVIQSGAQTFTDETGTTWQLWGVVPGKLTGTEDPVTLLDEALPYSAFTLRGLYPTDDKPFVNWLWIPALDNPETEFTIEWDAALTLLNAHGYSTNLTTVAALEAHGFALSDVKVTAPKGFKAKIAADAAGNVVATLELDEEVLRPLAADGVSSPLTILSNGDGTVTVKAAVANGVRGFWYALYAADELGGSWQVVTTGYEAGNPTVQAQADDATVEVSIDVAPTDAKKFYKLAVSDVKP